ncbi:UDP-3-O-(3-hydroxymyristoyl)glucosamine N-acyltransferase [Melioribacteraceae bacterium 4301-Me]|uniref:UDP-3-O-(3-hydroxymyristoyl)glucosamine N-acyltransferase n=1 Tax=Pyranulibacter aquaticus TaxID=3163344 RepID=UPI003596A6E7
MKITLKEAADLVGGNLIGDPNLEITNVAKIEEAKKGDLTFLYLSKYEKYLPTTKASAVLIKPDFNKSNKNTNYIEVDNPNAALQKIIVTYFKPELKISGIDPSAYIDKSAKIGRNVKIGKNVVISENCIVNDNTIILHNSVLMENVKIGENCIIYPNVTIRENCILGNNVIVHSGTVIGSDGFGYIQDEGKKYNKVPQIGNVILEDDVELGSNVSIDRATLGSTIIKRGTKIDNLVQVAHNVLIGENTVISAQVGISGSTKIGNQCVIAGQAGFVGHIEIADNVLIGAQSGVSKSITKAGKYRGTPIEELNSQLKYEAHIRNLPFYSEKIKKLEEKIAFLEAKISELARREKN